MATTDLTQQADLTRHDKGTGALRTRRPEYVDFMPPCNDACPAGENIQAWLDLAQSGQYEAAWRQLVDEYDVTVASICDGQITFGTAWGIGEFDIDKLIDGAEFIDGLPFVQLKHVIRYKMERASPKDLRHIHALRNSKYSAETDQYIATTFVGRA
jgi:hypothetical protein